MIYLDNSATTRALPQVVEAVAGCLYETFFNPASAYGPAVEAERQMNGARDRLAQVLGAQPNEIIYTSGGTEANNMAIFGVQKAHRACGRMITTEVEHPAVFEVFRRMEVEGFDVVYIGVDETGAARLDELESALTEDTMLVSMMHVNNEVGAINDIESAHALINRKAPEALLHVDGVQAFCKLPFFKTIPCELYSISGHKFHGPKGIGALYVKAGIPFSGGSIGGGQERGLRSGTSNTPGIMGMDMALAAYKVEQEAWMAHVRTCKLQMANHMRSIPDTFINGPAPEAGAPHVLSVAFPGVPGEALLHALSEKGVYISTGSACSAKKKGKNRILNAMGVIGPRQEGTIRISLCPFNTLKEMDDAAQAIQDTVTFLRRYQRR